MNNFGFIESIAFCRSQNLEKDITFIEDFDFDFFGHKRQRRFK